jgi:hypothetical protein
VRQLPGKLFAGLIEARRYEETARDSADACNGPVGLSDRQKNYVTGRLVPKVAQLVEMSDWQTFYVVSFRARLQCET